MKIKKNCPLGPSDNWLLSSALTLNNYVFRNSLYSREDTSSNHTLGYNSIFLLKSVLQFVPFGNQLDASPKISKTFFIQFFLRAKFEIL